MAPTIAWCRRRTRTGMRPICPCARLEMAPGELHLSMCFRSAARIQEACRELGRRRRDRAGRPLAQRCLLDPAAAPRMAPLDPIAQSARKYSTVETTRRRLAIW